MGAMKKSKKHSAEKKFSLWIAGAAAMHAVVLFLLLYLQLWDSGRQVKPKIVSVSLVSLPGSGGMPASDPATAMMPGETSLASAASKAVQEPQVEQLPPPAQKRIQTETPKNVAVELPKKVLLEPMTPKPVEKPSDIKSALERLKQSVAKKTAPLPESSSGNMNKALASLMQKVNADIQHAGAGVSGGRVSSSNGRSGFGNGYGGGGTADPYKAEIASIIQRNWAFSTQLLKNSYGMSVYVRINIVADGTIRQIVFDKRAPSEYLNNSVKRALEKSSPLPVPPKEAGVREVWIGFMFTPEGIE